MTRPYCFHVVIEAREMEIEFSKKHNVLNCNIFPTPNPTNHACHHHSENRSRSRPLVDTPPCQNRLCWNGFTTRSDLKEEAINHSGAQLVPWYFTRLFTLCRVYLCFVWTVFIFSVDHIYVGNYLGLPCNKPPPINSRPWTTLDFKVSAANTKQRSHQFRIVSDNKNTRFKPFS